MLISILGPFNLLPAEVQVQILIHVQSQRTTLKCMTASPTILQTYISNRDHILCERAAADFDELMIQDAIFIILSRARAEPASHSAESTPLSSSSSASSTTTSSSSTSVDDYEPLTSFLTAWKRQKLTGEKYGDQRDVAFTGVREACNGYFKGTYPRDKDYTKCYNLPGNKHIKVTIGLQGPNAGKTRYLGTDECYGGLKAQIAHCDRGGQKTYGNWKYRVDPNKGSC
ncbi:hypothetical protein HJFPF1_09649 [Paramyrothecium foliicola]|nr:hypothetical protein HJFPF1_09649 [Paramyrothecium foliicola]